MDSEAPFNKCTTLESVTKPIRKFKETDYRILGDKGVLPTHNVSESRVARTPLSGFVVSSKGSLQEESDLLKVRTDDGFDPNAYKLMKKSGYDFDKPVSLGHVIEAKPHGINETQKKIQEQGGVVVVLKVGLGYVPPQPIRISGQRKDKQSFAQYIAVEEIIENDEEDGKNKPKSSVFDRLQSSTSRGRTSVFGRVGNDKVSKSSTF